MADESKGLSLVQRLKPAGKRPYKLVEWPGIPGGKIGLQVPTEQEHEEAKLASWQFLVLTKGVDPDKVNGSSFYSREVFNQLLWRALFDPSGMETRPRIAESPEMLKAHMTGEERAMLLQELLDLMAEADPDVDTPEGQEAAALLCKEIQKKGLARAASVSILRGTPPAMLRRCMLILVRQLAALREAKSSSTSSSASASSQ